MLPASTIFCGGTGIDTVGWPNASELAIPVDDIDADADGCPKASADAMFPAPIIDTPDSSSKFIALLAGAVYDTSGKSIALFAGGVYAILRLRYVGLSLCGVEGFPDSVLNEYIGLDAGCKCLAPCSRRSGRYYFDLWSGQVAVKISDY